MRRAHSCENSQNVVSHTCPSIHRGFGGPSRSVPSLCHSLTKVGFKIRLHVIEGDASLDLPDVDVMVHSRWPFPKDAWFSVSLLRALRQEFQSGAVIHTHGMWRVAHCLAGWVAHDPKGKIVFSPHVSLAPWAMNVSKWKKRLAWWLLGQRLTLKRAACFHATAESEYEDIRRLGFRQPVAIIPNGIDIPALPSPDAETRAAKGSRRSAIRSHAQNRTLRHSPPCASGSTAPSGPTAPHLRRIEGLAGRFGEGIESCVDQHLVKSIVEHVPLRWTRILGPGAWLEPGRLRRGRRSR